MSEPLSDYQRWSYSIAHPMVDAGEDIRWVPRRLVSSVALPGNDFYLFDDRLAVFLCIRGMARAQEMISSADPADLRLCRSAFEAAWSCRRRTVTTPPSSSAKDAQRPTRRPPSGIRRHGVSPGRALAAATGQHFTRVSKIEHGVQPPRTEDIRDWCRACGQRTRFPT